MINVIHEGGGFVYLVMSDNLSVNQKLFKMFHTNYESNSIFSIVHPIKNTRFSYSYLFYDPTHLFKNIRNNWVTEKTQCLKFTDPITKKELVAKWSDLISLSMKKVKVFVNLRR